MSTVRKTVSYTKVVGYVPSPGAHLSKKDAVRYGKELDRLGKTGKITIERIVKEAERLKSPLHRWFDWNNTSAAEKWRQFQAASLLRSISIMVQTNDGEKAVRAFHCFQNAEGEDRALWIDSTTVFSDEELAQEVIGNALDELQGWKARYSLYKELAGIVSAINEAETKNTVRQSRSGLVR